MRLAAAGILGRQRSFVRDARAALSGAPAILVEGREHIPASGPFLLVMNHYNAPRVGVWWSALAVSACLPAEPRWIMTAAWTYDDWLRQHTLELLTAWAFARVARVYGFTSMPPMPPRPHELAARGAALRQVFHTIRARPESVVCLAPEGHNTPDLSLGWPPPGSGRFLLGLAQRLGQVLPVGVHMEEGELRVRFGPVFYLAVEPGLEKTEQDRQAARCVMKRIAELVPDGMRGEFAWR